MRHSERISREGGGGGVLRHFHTYVSSGHFFGLKFLNFNIFWGFQRNEFFGGYKDFLFFFCFFLFLFFFCGGGGGGWGSSQKGLGCLLIFQMLPKLSLFIRYHWYPFE